MSLVMREDQEHDFEEKGFVVLQNFLTPKELARLSAAADEVIGRIQREKGLETDGHFQVRNALAHHDALLDLVDHPRMLPLVVDAIGWNIQIRTTHLDYRPPYPQGLQEGEVGVGTGADQEAGYRNVVWHPDLASPEIFQAPSLDGRLPFMEIKVTLLADSPAAPGCPAQWRGPAGRRPGRGAVVAILAD